jgi:hypothetical protein
MGRKEERDRREGKEGRRRRQGGKGGRTIQNLFLAQGSISGMGKGRHRLATD